MGLTFQIVRMEVMTMTASNNLAELLLTLEEIRQENYPDIPKSIVERVLLLEYQHQDNRVKGRSLVRKVIKQYLREDES